MQSVLQRRWRSQLNQYVRVIIEEPEDGDAVSVGEYAGLLAVSGIDARNMRHCHGLRPGRKIASTTRNESS
jgi:hypothetical protein